MKKLGVPVRRSSAALGSRFPGVRLRLGLLTATAASGVFLVLVSLHAGESRGWTAFDDIGESVTPFIGALACRLSAHRASGRERTAWRLIGLGAAAWGAGQVIWTIDEVGRGFTPVSPSVCDLGFLASPLLIVAGILTFVATPTGALSRLRGIFEALLISGGLLLPVWTFLLAPVSDGFSGSWAEQTVTLAYPVFDAVGIAAVLFVLTRRHTHRLGSLPLLGGAIVLLAVSDSSFWYLTTVKSATGVQPTDAGWFSGFLLLAFAALAKHPSAAGDGKLLRRSWLVVATPDLVALSGLLATVGDRLIGGSGRFETPIAWMTSGLFALALGHGVAVALENQKLTDFLERRVVERTAKLAERERHFAALVERSSDIITVITTDLRISSVSHAVHDTFGWEAASLVGRRLDEFAGRFDPLIETLGNFERQLGGVRQIGWELLDARGRTRYADSKITNLLDDPAVRGFVVNTRDVTDQKLLELELRHQAFHDQLSGLANRALFNDRGEHALARSQRSGSKVAVLVIDLDGFKDVNDTLGHQAGDELLRGVAARIGVLARIGDTVARLGGDEFAVLMEDLDDADEAVAVAERLRLSLREGIELAGSELVLSASLGVAVSGHADCTIIDLLRDADIAMYVAKNSGKDAERLFEPWMRDRARERFELLAELAGSLERHEFVLHYQPLYELATGRLEGFEALLRWIHPSRGIVGPDEFIGLAEENGMIVPLGRWVLQEAMRQLAVWGRSHQVENLTVTINMSVRQIRDPRLVEDVRDAILAAGIAPEQIVLEITETMLVQDPREVARVLHALKQLGVRLAIDDFGTGYSSMSYLQNLPVDILKVDRSFVSPPAGEEKETRKLLGAILNLADTLGLVTFAEGIEEGEQAALLTDAGCDVGQGFLFSAALSAGEAGALLATETGTVGQGTSDRPPPSAPEAPAVHTRLRGSPGASAGQQSPV